MRLREYAEKYYLQHRNCAESLLLAANDAYELGLTEREIQMMKAFGGGMGAGGACGALTGAVAALSLLYSTTKGAVENGLRTDAGQLVTEFEAALTHVDCRVLKPIYFDAQNRCLETVLRGADVLEKHIAALNGETM